MLCAQGKKKSSDQYPPCFCYLINPKGYQNMDLTRQHL